MRNDDLDDGMQRHSAMLSPWNVVQSDFQFDLNRDCDMNATNGCLTVILSVR